MSASLVGSEMCIRDRSAPLRIVVDRVWAVTGPWLESKTDCGRRGGVGCCLLYTSDAADDM
eukprot:6217637-Alexandrium_andersonii.AAC.1